MATMATEYWTATAFTAMYRQTTSAATTRKQQEQEEEEARWNQHKYGLCPICKIGLDDRADFTFNYDNGSKCGTMMCFECDAKKEPKNTCRNCAAQVKDKEIMVCSWDGRTLKTVVFRCSRCIN
jgi:hypothetical protein